MRKYHRILHHKFSSPMRFLPSDCHNWQRNDKLLCLQNIDKIDDQRFLQFLHMLLDRQCHYDYILFHIFYLNRHIGPTDHLKKIVHVVRLISWQYKSVSHAK